MKEDIKKWLHRILRATPFVICVVLALALLFSGRDISAEDLLHYAPENPLFAAVFLIVLYGLKSLSLLFPIIVLNFAGGFLFPPLTAVAVNSLGAIFELTLPYWIGKGAGAGFAEKLCDKYPRLKEILRYQQGNSFFVSFLLRSMHCLPTDIISMYLGASGAPFFRYLTGSFLGVFPGLVAATLLGGSISDTSSPMFWISAVGMVILTASALVFHRLWIKRRKNGNTSPMISDKN